MTDVADLDKCKELYELSGWRTGRFFFEALPGVWETAQENDFDEDDVPAYDAGYLLRALPKPLGQMSGSGKAHWTAAHEEYFGNADTPENALCQLAIELFKAGVLTKETE